MRCWARGSGTTPRCCASGRPSSAWTILPHFYALSENYGEPDKDYLLQYQEGRLTWEAKTVYETMLNEGALDTVSLRKLARMTTKASDSPFNRALETLQADFKILPVGIARGGRVEIRLHLRVRPPPLSRSARAGARHPPGGGAAAAGRALSALGGRGPVARSDTVVRLAKKRSRRTAAMLAARHGAERVAVVGPAVDWPG